MARRSVPSAGAATLLIVIGALLLVFPEPATSGIGALLLVIGIILWFL